ncbi:MAG: ankyrin repeat domain-containing protein [Wolbachia sp.]
MCRITGIYLFHNNGKIQKAETSIKKKVNINIRVKDESKDDGPTALHIAAFYDHKNMIKYLLKR